MAESFKSKLAVDNFDDLVSRFQHKVSKKANASGCWLWVGYTDKRNGQGQMRAKHGDKWSHVWVHRLAYYLEYGDFDADKKVIHLCTNFNCVRPDHLILGEPIDIVNIVYQRQRQQKKFTKQRFCQKGHDKQQTGEDLSRHCMACVREKIESRKKEKPVYALIG
jgi:hypothetical protein